MQQGEGKEQERKTGQRGKVYMRHRNREGKNEERVSLLLSIEQKLCSEWNTSLHVPNTAQYTLYTVYTLNKRSEVVLFH